MPDQFQPRGILLPIGFILALFLAALVFPPLGVVVGMLSPIPLIFVYLQRGMVAGMVLVGLVFLVLLVVLGGRQATLFFAEYAVMALIMAETIRLRLSFDKCIFYSAVGSAVLSVFFLVALVGERGETLTDFFKKQIQGHFDQSLETLKTMGESQEELDTMRQFAEGAAEMFAGSYPSFIVIGALVTAIANFYFVRLLWNSIYQQSTLFPESRFSRWVLPDTYIWALILAAGGCFLGQELIGFIAINVLVLMLVIYFLQGLGVVVYFLDARKIPFVFWLLVFLLIFIQPLLMGLVIGLGIFDIWADFRKIRVPPPSPDDAEMP